jgi:hypothetical protein
MDSGATDHEPQAVSRLLLMPARRKNARGVPAGVEPRSRFCQEGSHQLAGLDPCPLKETAESEDDDVDHDGPATSWATLPDARKEAKAQLMVEGTLAVAGRPGSRPSEEVSDRLAVEVCRNAEQRADARLLNVL